MINEIRKDDEKQRRRRIQERKEKNALSRAKMTVCHLDPPDDQVIMTWKMQSGVRARGTIKTAC
jgi:hypothetical protein